MPKAVGLLLVGTIMVAGVCGTSASEPERLPSFVLYGSQIGEPTALRLPVMVDPVPSLPKRGDAVPRTIGTFGLRDAVRATRSGDKTASIPDDEDDDDDETPSSQARPGRLPTSFVKYPNPVPSLRNRSLGPHLRPDAEFDLSDRTSIGVIQQLESLRPATVGSFIGRLQPMLTGTKPAVAHPTRAGRDLGLGATLEFKLGQ